MRMSRGTRSLELWEAQLGQGQMEVLGVGSPSLQGAVWQPNIGQGRWVGDLSLRPL